MNERGENLDSNGSSKSCVAGTSRRNCNVTRKINNSGPREAVMQGHREIHCHRGLKPCQVDSFSSVLDDRESALSISLCNTLRTRERCVSRFLSFFFFFCILNAFYWIIIIKMEHIECRNFLFNLKTAIFEFCRNEIISTR